MKMGKIIAGYGECQTEMREQNAGLFNVQALSTHSIYCCHSNRTFPCG